MVKTIEPQAFETELLIHDTPLLVAFLKRNERYGSQARTLDAICDSHEDIRCYLYDSDYLDTALERYAVEGTPTFLLFSQGREVDRLIGETDDEALDEFVRSSMTK